MSYVPVLSSPFGEEVEIVWTIERFPFNSCIIAMMLMNPKHNVWCHRNCGETRLHLTNGEKTTRIITNHQLIIKNKKSMKTIVSDDLKVRLNFASINAVLLQPTSWNSSDKTRM